MDPALTVQPPDTESIGSLTAVLLSHPGFVLALRERRRMVESLGCTCLLDPTRQSSMQMAKAAACFLRQAVLLTSVGAGAAPGTPFPDWPWAPETWKPPHTAEEALVRAMAFIGAELDRIVATRAKETAAARLDPGA